MAGSYNGTGAAGSLAGGGGGSGGTVTPSTIPGLYVLNGIANWANATTIVATVPASLTYGLTLIACVAYNAAGTQPSSFSLGFGTAANLLSSRSLTGMTTSTFSTFTPSGAGSLGTSGQSIIIGTVGGAVTGGGTCQFDLLCTAH